MGLFSFGPFFFSSALDLPRFDSSVLAYLALALRWAGVWACHVRRPACQQITILKSGVRRRTIVLLLMSGEGGYSLYLRSGDVRDPITVWIERLTGSWMP
jgi:hypothetical protein